MIFANHDFTHNFLNAVGYQDDMAVKQMVIDELAKLIVEEKKDVVTLLRSEGLNVSYADNNLTVSDFVTKEIKKGNQKVIDAVSKMITAKSLDEDDANKMVASFIGADSSKNKVGSKLLSGLKNLASNEDVKEGVSNLISMQLQKTYNKNNKKTASNQDQLDQRLIINETKTTKKSKKGAKKGLKIALIVTGSLVITTIAILIIKKNTSSGSSSSSIE